MLRVVVPSLFLFLLLILWVQLIFVNVAFRIKLKFILSYNPLLLEFLTIIDFGFTP